MGLRFQRRVTIAKGLTLNFSKSGIGISAGPRGAKIGLGPRGAHYSLGIPGTGLAYRKQTSKTAGARRGSTRSTAPTTVGVQITLDASGKLHFLDSDDAPLPPQLVKRLKTEQASKIRQFLEEQCQRLNGGIHDILNVHYETPSPLDRIRYHPVPFGAPKPLRPTPRAPSLLERFLPGRRARMERTNRESEAVWRGEFEKWQHAKAAHEAQEHARERELLEGLLTDEAVMQRVLEERLTSLAWPRETNLSYELTQDGRMVALDIDLPEVEDMPNQKAEIAAAGFKLNLKTKSATQVRKEYQQFVHAILFRAIGEAFFALPNSEHVLASGYSQRPDPTTGRVRDDYLISVRVDRSRWQDIDFTNLSVVDLVTAFERFELTRDMTKTGIFKPITPLPLDG